MCYAQAACGFSISLPKLKASKLAPNIFVCVISKLTHLSKMDITAPS